MNSHPVAWIPGLFSIERAAPTKSWERYHWRAQRVSGSVNGVDLMALRRYLQRSGGRKAHFQALAAYAPVGVELAKALPDRNDNVDIIVDLVGTFDDVGLNR
jgi:hypothetical protein